jgi:type IV secretion system protein VirB9
MMRHAALALLLLLPANRAPQSRGIDGHIQHVFYNPDDVVRLTGAIGWQITLEFAPDERIENVSIGDSLSWQVTPNKRAKMLFLKPLTAKASTNMTVITSQRQYVFALATAPRSTSTPWIVRFDYPRTIVETLPEPPAPPQPRLNFAYKMAGDPILLPSRVWDDGRQTYFEFAPEASLPAIFAGGPGKDEALVNVVNQGRIAVVQQTSGRYTLRTGKRFATVTYTPLDAPK